MWMVRGLFLCAGLAAAQNITPLWERGYSVIPTPRSAQLEAGDVAFGPEWSLDAGGVAAGHAAVHSLAAGLAEFHGVVLRSGAGAKTVRLTVSPGAVATKAARQIDSQAYRLRIGDSVIEIAGNSEAGLFYGVQTLVQLPRRDPAGRLLLPKGVIEDWPRLEMRFLHWDTKHHQDRMETLKRYLDWSARLKVNRIAFELEDKFEYPSHPVIGAPGAFTTAQLQEIVNYGLERFIQVVPVVQSPAHMAYVLKHPEFADLRADNNNYQSKLCDPRTYDLIFSMYDDVVKATRGVDYFFVSTDEVYYAGIEGCKPYNPQNRSLAWVEFVRRAHAHLAKHGRRILAWVEYPLLAEHVHMLPPDLIDGIIGEPEYIPIENRLGMRQLAYVSMQGSEFLFPNHLALEEGLGVRRGRVAEARDSIASGRHWQGNPIGAFGAAWGDSGLHNETFWLGWSAAAQYGWNPAAAPVEQHVAEFMSLYYGPRTEGMIEIYRSMQRQARSWERTWDSVTSRVRAAGYGNSHGKGIGTRRTDLALAPPPLPSLPDLDVKPLIGEKYAAFLAEARDRAIENERLTLALAANMGKADRNRYNLEVFLSLARFMGHHWRLVAGLHAAEQSLGKARDAARKKNASEAVGHLVGAHNTIERLREEGERAFRELTAVFEKSHFPKGQSAGGRKFVHVLDDTKDHWADRTADLGFMMAPERGIGLEKWSQDLSAVTRAYAKVNGVPVRGLAAARLEE